MNWNWHNVNNETVENTVFPFAEISNELKKNLNVVGFFNSNKRKEREREFQRFELLNSIHSKQWNINHLNEFLKNEDNLNLGFLQYAIGHFDKELNHIEEVEKNSFEKASVFFNQLKNSIEMQIISNRIQNIGFDPEYSFTYQEYKNAFDCLVNNRRQNSNGLKMNVLLSGVSFLLSILTENPVYNGIFFTSSLNLMYFALQS